MIHEQIPMLILELIDSKDSSGLSPELDNYLMERIWEELRSKTGSFELEWFLDHET